MLGIVPGMRDTKMSITASVLLELIAPEGKQTQTAITVWEKLG